MTDEALDYEALRNQAVTQAAAHRQKASKLPPASAGMYLKVAANYDGLAQQYAEKLAAQLNQQEKPE